jgi:hypothetical protein
VTFEEYARHIDWSLTIDLPRGLTMWDRWENPGSFGLKKINDPKRPGTRSR